MPRQTHNGQLFVRFPHVVQTFQHISNSTVIFSSLPSETDNVTLDSSVSLFRRLAPYDSRREYHLLGTLQKAKRLFYGLPQSHIFLQQNNTPQNLFCGKRGKWRQVEKQTKFVLNKQPSFRVGDARLISLAIPSPCSLRFPPGVPPFRHFAKSKVPFLWSPSISLFFTTKHTPQNLFCQKRGKRRQVEKQTKFVLNKQPSFRVGDARLLCLDIAKTDTIKLGGKFYGINDFQICELKNSRLKFARTNFQLKSAQAHKRKKPRENSRLFYVMIISNIF